MEVDMRAASPEFLLQIKGYGLMLVEVKYYYPDHPSILAQPFTTQMYVIAPLFPVLRDFIEFWKSDIEGRLHSVRYDHQPLIGPSEYRKMDGLITIN